MYSNIFKTAVIDCDVSHRFIISVTHPQSFPYQRNEYDITNKLIYFFETYPRFNYILLTKFLVNVYTNSLNRVLIFSSVRFTNSIKTKLFL